MAKFLVTFDARNPISWQFPVIKALHEMTGISLSEAIATIDKFVPPGKPYQFDMVVSGDQFARFYAKKNRGDIHQHIILRNTREWVEPENKICMLA